MPTRRIWVTLGVIVTWAMGASALAWAGSGAHAIRPYVDSYVQKTTSLQKSRVIPAAQGAGRAAGAAESGCQQHPESRPYLGQGFEEIGHGLHGYLVASEYGELQLYKLAPKLGSVHAAARRLYVKDLDRVGHGLDLELNEAKEIVSGGGKMAGGNCSGGANQIIDATGRLAVDRGTVQNDLHTLLRNFG